MKTKSLSRVARVAPDALTIHPQPRRETATPRRAGRHSNIENQKSKIEHSTAPALDHSKPPSGPLAEALTPSAAYALRKGLGFWELTFEGHTAILKHEQGLVYVAWLLTHPPAEPIHGLAITLKAAALYEPAPAETLIRDPINGRSVAMAGDTTVQERYLAIDDAQAAWNVRRKQLELEAILDDDDTCEPVKAEALRELAELYDFQKRNTARTRTAAQRAVRAVGVALRRLHEHLAEAVDARGRPHPVLRPFARHLQRHLLVPSGRYSGAGPARKLSGIAGCFTYEPPPNVVWVA